ncbi:AAA family ATPase [Streptomyces sp. NPDC048266]|uniref:helix-turn-helix transcriptional regulator n=1 Tax=Streptomyces sp. NPDC048266 TaxID=3155787 RepID=UPI0033E34B43
MVGVEWVLLEREAEAAVVTRAVKDAAQGAGGMLLVAGPAGIGKTRLLGEVRAAASIVGKGTEWASARASELERGFAFGVVRQLFEPLCAAADTKRQAALWQGPAAQAREAVLAPVSAASPAGEFAVLHGLFWLTVHACRDRPLVLLVDDLQWCDAPSLRYLVYLLPRITDLGVLVAATLRTGEPATDTDLVRQLATDPATTMLQPQSLSVQATERLLQQAFAARGVDSAFAAACHKASGGNPLLLRELARTLTAQGIPASAGNAAQVAELGPRAVTALVAARMAHLPPATVALARAVAVLGDRTDLLLAAAHASQDPDTALQGADALEQLEIFHLDHDDSAPGNPARLSFVHPMVSAAVYDSLGRAEQVTAHHRAARLLAEAGADPEQSAAHLLQSTPSGQGWAVDALRDAAARAEARGAPQAALRYLRHCLNELPAQAEQEQRLSVLTELQAVAPLVNMAAARDYLQQAIRLTTDPHRKAELLWEYGAALYYAGRSDEAERVYKEAIALLPSNETDIRRRIQAGIVTISTGVDTGFEHLHDEVALWWRLEPENTIGSRMLDCAIGAADAYAGRPEAISRLRRGLLGGYHSWATAFSIGSAYFALAAADMEELIDILDSGLAVVHRRGDLEEAATLYSFRGLARWGRGQLTEAEADASEGLRCLEILHQDLSKPLTASWLAEILMDQGRLDDAAVALNRSGVPNSVTQHPSGPVQYALIARARLQHLYGDHGQALESALNCGEYAKEIRIYNPAILPWRTHAATCLHALNRNKEAHRLALTELDLARRWGAPRALGRALRVTGLIHGGPQSLALLKEAVHVLEGSPARLEHAKALADLGAALRRSNQRQAARPYLRQAAHLAALCGAAPLAEHARTELAAAGGRQRTTAMTGPDALTPSERRVAELAAGGATNQQIAQVLFVTPKTVEVHLSAAYRKLGVHGRAHLPTVLATAGRSLGNTGNGRLK